VRSWLLLTTLCCAAAGRAQGPADPAWTLLLNGTPTAWRPAPAWTPDSLAVAARDALAWLRRRGYAAARFDSAVVDGAGRLYASAGAPVRVQEVRLDVTPPALAETLRPGLGLAVGNVFSDSLVQAAAAGLVAAAAEAGFPLALVEPSVEEGGAVVAFRVEAGAALVLDRIEISGSRARPAFVAQVLGLRVGRPMRGFRPERAAARLETTGLYRRVSAPTVEVAEGGRVVVRIALEDEPPGAFDLALGLLPPAGGQKASLVGTGSLALRNLLGAGYGLAVQLNRLPGRAATASARASALYPAGWPVRLEGRFEGVQQDSTLGRQRYRLEGGTDVGGVEVTALISVDRVRPGVAGARLPVPAAIGTRQPIARADGLFTGLGLRYARADDRLNPRQGFALDLTAEVGRRDRAFSEVTAGGVVRRRARVRQERLDAHARLFIPTLPRQALALGADLWAVRGEGLDEGDLVRLGGPATLRGYDDDRFRARAAVRGFAEARYRLDRLSYAFLFAETAYLDRLEAAPDGVPRFTREWRPGYGLGLQLSTDVGLVTATYAASPEDGPALGRIHVALSFGL
jgi:outer membrane protein assembly factor BamA